MSSFPLRRPGRPEPASEQAAAWVLRQENGPLNESEQERFADWLAQDDLHARAYENALWALDAVARHAGESELRDMRHAALAARGNRRQRVWGWTAAFGAAAAALVAIGVWTNALQPPVPRMTSGAQIAQVGNENGPSIYRTGVGERSAIELPDGSVATLDTASELKVAYTTSERGVYLIKGQALFEVAHGKPMPFEVYARGQRITAVGTTFNVRIDGEKVRVSMIEGTVKVREAPKPGQLSKQPIKELTLAAGESLDFAPAHPLVVKPIDIQQVASWKDGVLVFNDMPLGQAISEINRYTSKPITIANNRIANYRVTGVFQSNDPEHFAQAMREVFPIKVIHREDGAPRLDVADHP